MIEVNGTRFETEMVSATAAAKALKIPMYLINEWIDTFGVDVGGPLRLNRTKGGQTRVNILDVERIWSNNGRWPDSNDGDPEIYDPVIEDPPPVPPRPGTYKGPRYVYQISRQPGTPLETWGADPTEKQIADAFGPGHYRVVTIDNLAGGITTNSRILDIAAPAAAANPQSEIEKQLLTLKTMAELVRSMNPATPAASGDGGRLSELMFRLQAEMNQMLLTQVLSKTNTTGAGELIKAMAAFKDMGAFGNGGGDDTLSLIEKILEVVPTFLGGGQGGAAAPPTIPTGPQYVPAPADPVSRVRPAAPAIPAAGGNTAALAQPKPVKNFEEGGE